MVVSRFGELRRISDSFTPVPPTRGVGKSATVSVLEAPRLARGVGSTEPALTTVGGTHAGRGYNRPVRIEPDRGKVCEDGIKCPQMLS